MPIAMLEMLEGHSVEEKRQLVQDITKAFVKIGVPAESVQVILRETPKSCWAEGGTLCSDFEVPSGA